jgi:hypothetical protein
MNRSSASLRDRITTRYLEIKIYEGLVCALLPMVFCENLRQPSGPLFHFDRVSFSIFTGSMKANPESRSTHGAQLKRPDRERWVVRQFFVRDGHRVKNFI